MQITFDTIAERWQLVQRTAKNTIVLAEHESFEGIQKSLHEYVTEEKPQGIAWKNLSFLETKDTTNPKHESLKIYFNNLNAFCNGKWWDEQCGPLATFCIPPVILAVLLDQVVVWEKTDNADAFAEVFCALLQMNNTLLKDPEMPLQNTETFGVAGTLIKSLESLVKEKKTDLVGEEWTMQLKTEKESSVIVDGSAVEAAIVAKSLGSIFLKDDTKLTKTAPSTPPKPQQKLFTYFYPMSDFIKLHTPFPNKFFAPDVLAPDNIVKLQLPLHVSVNDEFWFSVSKDVLGMFYSPDASTFPHYTLKEKYQTAPKSIITVDSAKDVSVVESSMWDKANNPTYYKVVYSKQSILGLCSNLSEFENEFISNNSACAEDVCLYLPEITYALSKFFVSVSGNFINKFYTWEYSKADSKVFYYLKDEFKYEEVIFSHEKPETDVLTEESDLE